MTVIFYEMQGCGHCHSAKKALANEIASGLVVIKPSSDANGQFQGFPAFVDSITGNSHLGAVRSYSELANKLGMSVENFEMAAPHGWSIGVL